MSPKPQNPQKPENRPPTRKKVGWIALGMAVLVAYGFWSGEAGLLELNRMCVMMFLLWLAWPELERLPRWIFFAIPILVVLCAWRPQLLLFVGPALFFLWLLQPPKSRRSKKTTAAKTPKSSNSPKSR